MRRPLLFGISAVLASMYLLVLIDLFSLAHKDEIHVHFQRQVEQAKRSLKDESNRPVQQQTPPEPVFVRYGEPKYLPAEKPANETCLKFIKGDHGCFRGEGYVARRVRFCKLKGMALDASKFHVTKGGERPEDVAGRRENAEFFSMDRGGVFLPYSLEINSTDRYVSKLLRGAVLGVPETRQCNVYLKGLTLMIERADYANLFHMTQSWFNAHWVLEELRYRGGELRFLWLDGHAASNIDDVWADVFHANITRISQYEGIVCFEEVSWIPLESVIEHGTPSRDCGIMDRFVDRVRSAYGVTSLLTEPKLDLVIDRQPYFAHPRVNLNRAKMDTRIVPNLEKHFPDSKVIRLHEMTFGEQVRAVSNAKRLRGLHGAGLTHLLWLPDGAEVVEWKQADRFVAYFLFEALALWRPRINYTFIPLPQMD